MKKIYPESVDAEQEFGPIPGPGGGPRWRSTPLRMAYTPYYVPISINVPCIQAWYDEINEMEQNAYWPLAWGPDFSWQSVLCFDLVGHGSRNLGQVPGKIWATGTCSQRRFLLNEGASRFMRFFSNVVIMTLPSHLIQKRELAAWWVDESNISPGCTYQRLCEIICQMRISWLQMTSEG